MKLSGNIDIGTMNRCFDFGSDPDHFLDPGIFVKRQNRGPQWPSG